jgi:hypothetical protein
MTDPLQDFFFGDDAGFLIPAEHLGPDGIDPAFAARLPSEHADEGWLGVFNAAFALYQARVNDLFARSPRHWFPGRRSNVFIVTAPEATHPYLRPLSRSAWLLYASDFAPATSSVELAAFLFVQAERLNIVGDVQQTLAKTLSYFVGVEGFDDADFRAGCEACTRPDATGYRALAGICEFPGLFHQDLRPLSLELAGYGVLGDTGLVVPASFEQTVAPVAAAFEDAAKTSVADYYRRQAPTGAESDAGAGQELLAWLTEAKPFVLLVNSAGDVLWDPEQPSDTRALAQRFKGLGEAPAAGIRRDLQLIHDRSRAFLDALKDPGSLPEPTEEVDQEGGTYIHTQRGMIAFDVEQQASWVPLREATPPYQRLLLAARTVHEWGHLADESGLISIPAENQDAAQEARAELAAAFDDVVQKAPPPVRSWAEARLPEILGASGGRIGEALADYALRRLPDFAANRLMTHFLEPAELESYLRVNVRTHAEEGIDPFQLLARHAVEYQYLRLSRGLEDPMTYFLELTGVDRVLIQGGLLTLGQLEAILDATWKACECYVVDAGRFRALPARSADR